MENTKKSRADWLGLARAWEDSGLSQGAFCRERGLKLATFGYWRTQYLREHPGLEPDEGSSFVVLEPERRVTSVTLRMGGVELELGAEADFLADVLLKMAERC
jgi:hypothetical protein